MDVVSNFHVPRAREYRHSKHFVALFVQKNTKITKEAKYSASDADRSPSRYRLSPVNFRYLTGNQRGARRRYFLLLVLYTGTIE